MYLDMEVEESEDVEMVDTEDKERVDTEDEDMVDNEKAHKGHPEDTEEEIKYNMDGEEDQCPCHNHLVSITRGKQTRPLQLCSKIQRPLARLTVEGSDYRVYSPYFYNTLLL
jgi:hypothetical protein